MRAGGQWPLVVAVREFSWETLMISSPGHIRFVSFVIQVTTRFEGV